MNFKKQIFAMARQDIKTLVFPEASFSDKIMGAVKIITQKQLAKVIVIGDPNSIFAQYSSLESSNLKIVNPKTSVLTEEVVQKIFELRSNHGVSMQEAQKLAHDPYYFACALVVLDYADAIVSGTESQTIKTYQPAQELIGGVKEEALLTSANIYVGKNAITRNRPILISDCALMKEPDSRQLSLIAKKCVDLWRTLFFEEPKVAFLSYCTNQVGEYSKMKEATNLFKKEYPDVVSDGEMQLDCALIAKSQAKKFPDSKIKGDANILIVPDINTGNALGKAFHTVGGLMGVGPIGLGFAKPVSQVSRSASVEEIVLISAITAIQAQIIN